MVDKQHNLDGSNGRDGSNGKPEMGDDDPLAELARIVGYEQDPAARGRADEPVDLDDELMRELDTGDHAPSLDAPDDARSFGERRDGDRFEAASVPAVEPSAFEPSTADPRASADDLMTLSLEEDLERAFDVSDEPESEPVDHGSIDAFAVEAAPEPLGAEPLDLRHDEDERPSSMDEPVAAEAGSEEGFVFPGAGEPSEPAAHEIFDHSPVAEPTAATHETEMTHDEDVAAPNASVPISDEPASETFEEPRAAQAADAAPARDDDDARIDDALLAEIAALQVSASGRSNGATKTDRKSETANPSALPVARAADGAAGQTEPKPAETAQVDDDTRTVAIPDVGLVPVAGTAKGIDFDPAAICEPDEAVEAAPDLGIPRLEDDDPRTASVADDDLDYDMDTEILGLINPRATKAAEPVEDAELAGEQAPRAAPPAEIASAPAMDADISEREASDFADLERALDARRYGHREGNGAASQGTVVDHAPNGARTAAGAPKRWTRLAVTAAGLVIVAGAGAAFWMGSTPVAQSSAGGNAPIIMADATPAKRKPENPGGEHVPNQNKIVYDRVDGSDPDSDGKTALTDTTEKPLDVVKHNQPIVAASMGGGDNGLPGVRSASENLVADASDGRSSRLGKEQDRLQPQESKPAPEAATPSGVVPHYVKTMTVTADGHLVPLNDGKSGSNDASADADDNSAQTASTPDAAAMVTGTDEPAPLPDARPGGQAQDASTDDGDGASEAAGADADADETQTTTASAASAARTSDDASGDGDEAPANPGGYYVQIASQPSEDAAKRSYQTLKKRYGSVLDGEGVDIQSAKVSDDKTYYRIRIPAGTSSDASDLCARYKKAGGDCFVTQ
ncbi:SPOR domain-containing protein [Pararhizobium mangrovi]|uniref:SPOR domain-containing protein n=1 Tax=Pararhizobium mangrovi TaxID=2590452 RepID=A0A506U7V9_9HYPH|nr:SPOR domain-containing protein [Pararhizobium mangrovi]TPW29568.1 hypothetical protein FJU11_06915 [Pararhizobium mangrovi]